MNDKKLIVIAGPTAVGKTGLALQLAEFLKTEIVSADSRQVFKELVIGTAKPSARELAEVKHHFINTQSIHERYDAGTFGREARDVIDIIFETHEHVILCGGSGLYIKALLEGFDDLPPVPSHLREQIAEEYDQKGLEWLQHEVASQDPDYFDVVDRQNPQRLMRAMEIIRNTGKPFSEFHNKQKQVLPFHVIKVGLQLDREELYRRIDQRMDEMISKGLFDEAKDFFSLRHLNALQTVGYEEVFGFLEGKYDEAEAIRLLKRNSRRYAKRQMTWFKKDPGIKWFHPDDWGGITSFLKENGTPRQ